MERSYSSLSFFYINGVYLTESSFCSDAHGLVLCDKVRERST